MADIDKSSIRPKKYAYDLDEESLPIYVGEGFGNLTYEAAVELSQTKRTSLGLRSDREFIVAGVPLPTRKRDNSSKSRASKNNPYVCPHCEYKTTRYGNMIQHLTKIHGDYSTDPRHN